MNALNITGSTKADMIARDKASASKDPRAMISPINGSVMASWKGQVTK